MSALFGKEECNMKKEGIVICSEGDSVKVKILRESACGSDCSKCGAACKSREYILEAKNIVNAQAGDRVVIEMPAKRVLNAAFLIYILPLAALMTGYFTAGFFTKSDVICALAGFIFMIIGFFLLHIYDKKVREKYRPCAVSLLNQQS